MTLASELGQKYATRNYPSQGTPIICKLHGPSIKPRSTIFSKQWDNLCGVSKFSFACIQEMLSCSARNAISKHGFGRDNTNTNFLERDGNKRRLTIVQLGGSRRITKLVSSALALKCMSDAGRAEARPPLCFRQGRRHTTHGSRQKRHADVRTGSHPCIVNAAQSVNRCADFVWNRYCHGVKSPWTCMSTVSSVHVGGFCFPAGQF